MEVAHLPVHWPKPEESMRPSGVMYVKRCVQTICVQRKQHTVTRLRHAHTPALRAGHYLPVC